MLSVHVNSSRAVDGCLLARFALFQGIDPESYHQLASCARRRRLSAGEAIYTADSCVASLFGILDGSVKLVLQSREGREITFRHVTGGEIFGETELFTAAARSTEAIAMTKCDLVELRPCDVMPVLERDPKFCLRLLEFVTERLQAATNQVAEVSLLDLRARLARVLLRQVEWQSGSPSPRIAILQRELAEIAGSSREYINRILKEWERASIVRLDNGSIYLLARDELARIAGLL